MQIDKIKNLYKYYMIFIGIAGQLVFYAQAYKIFTTCSATDVSKIGFIAGFISVTSWFIYGMLLKDKPLIVANAFAMIGAVLVLIGIGLYS